MFDDGVEIRIQRIHLSGNLAADLDRHDGLNHARRIDYDSEALRGRPAL